MSYANMINCRTVREKEFNVLKNSWGHKLFWVVFVIMNLIQYVMLQFGEVLRMARPESFAAFCTTCGCAAFTLILGALIKFIDVKKFKFITLDLETVSDTDNFVTRGMKKIGDKYEERKV